MTTNDKDNAITALTYDIGDGSMVSIHIIKTTGNAPTCLSESGKNEKQNSLTLDCEHQSSEITPVPSSTLEQFMLCAFRYAITRRSGVLSEMLCFIDPYWHCLNTEFQRQIKWDIKHYMEGGRIYEEDKPMCMEFLKR